MKNRALRYTLGLAATGFIITLLVYWIQQGTLHTYQRNLPYLRLGDQVENNATTAHLWFEELLAGDKSVDFERDVMHRFVASKELLQAAYDGKESELGVFEQSADEDVRAILKLSIIDLEKLISAAQGRWEMRTKLSVSPPPVTIALDSNGVAIPSPVVTVQQADESLAGAKIDQDFDASFETLIINLGTLENHFNTILQKDSSYLTTVSWLSIILMIVAFSVLCFLLYRLQHGNDVLSEKNEIGLQEQMAAVGHLSHFIEAVSSGDFSVELNLSGESGDLSSKLTTMRDKLKENATSERKLGYSTMGLAQVGEILRSNTGNAVDLYDNIIRYLVKYTKSNQGGLFIINEDDDHQSHLDLAACYAFERKKFLTKRVDPGEGLVGQSFLEGDRIYLKEVPDDYVSITSGLGGAKPKALLLVPMKLNDKIYGVIELATFTKYEDFEIELVEKLAESIASTISTVRVNDSTRILLEKTQEQAEQMKAQEEEIRQNMEELEATQEEMRRKQTILEKELMQSQQQAEALKIQELRLTESQVTLQAIVDNIPRAIFWKDADLKFMGCNKIFASIAGVASHHDMFGKTDYDMAWSAQADAYRKDDFEVMKSRIAKLDIEEVNVNSQGEESWVLTSKVPIMNQNNEVVAILGMFEDITQRKHQEADVREKLHERELALKEIENLKRLLEAKG